MGRKSILICVLIILIILIGFGCIIIFNGNLKKSKSPTANPVIEKEDTDTMKESDHEKEKDDAYIQLEYPNKISYPEMKQFDITISNYPVNSAYCKISADLGSTSIRKIYLKKENQITYYFPDNFDGFMFDTILFEFYDENSRLIDDTKITIEYDKDEKQFQIFEMKIT